MPHTVPATAPTPLAGSDEVRLADLTTLRVGGAVGRLVDAESEAELIETVRAADAAGESVLVLGGGSNVLASDSRFEGVVVRDARRGTVVEDSSACGGASVRVPAGEIWDDVVARAVEEGWSGLEALSGIPGSAGATPVQNVGAYGHDVASVISSVRTWDRAEARVRTLARGELGLGYRTSLLKRTLTEPAADGRRWGPTPRYVVLDVGLQMVLADRSAPIEYAELARVLDEPLGARPRAALVREAVLELRRGKGMVLDEADHDTWSAGSFFTNPILEAARADELPERAPRWDASPGLVKTSAAWLIQHAGFERGWGLEARARLSGKHVLALTNRGGASAQDVLELARAVRDGVIERFGVRLEPEPVLVGLTL